MTSLRKIKVKRSWIPLFVVKIKGRRHAKKHLVILENNTARSPYLLERRYAYVEFREKLIRAAKDEIYPLKKKLYEVEEHTKVENEKLLLCNTKLAKLENVGSGSQYRKKIHLEAEREALTLRISNLETEAQCIKENINSLQQQMSHVLDQELANIQSKAYVYILGADEKTKIFKHYLELNDVTRDSFADLIPTNLFG